MTIPGIGRLLAPMAMLAILNASVPLTVERAAPQQRPRQTSQRQRRKAERAGYRKRVA